MTEPRAETREERRARAAAWGPEDAERAWRLGRAAVAAFERENAHRLAGVVPWIAAPSPGYRPDWVRDRLGSLLRGD